jgi:uncharacterized SAM-binding protein YcdF (DUF218 family)
LRTLFFNKILPIFVLPLGVVILILVAAIRWRSRKLIASAIVILWAFSAPVVSDALTRSLEDRYAYHPNAEEPMADAIFALGGGVTGMRDGGERLEWGPTADRLIRAIDLFNAGRARILVLSAGALNDSGQITQGVRFREIALLRGVPSESIIVTRETINTAAEADALSELASRFNWKRVLLVTSAYHMPRAMLLFRDCPAEIVPVPVNFQSVPAGMASDFQLGDYLPNAEALFHSERACREYLGIAFYSAFRRSGKPRQAH